MVHPGKGVTEHPVFYSASTRTLLMCDQGRGKEYIFVLFIAFLIGYSCVMQVYCMIRIERLRVGIKESLMIFVVQCRNNSLSSCHIFTCLQLVKIFGMHLNIPHVKCGKIFTSKRILGALGLPPSDRFPSTTCLYLLLNCFDCTCQWLKLVT